MLTPDAKPFADLSELRSVMLAMAGLPDGGEAVGEFEHCLQCAEALRAVAPEDEELQIAGLLHDIGSAPGQAAEHGRIAAAALRPLLGERVAELARLHVDAKRYIVTRDPAYRAALSPFSRRTLALQGDIMSAEELAAFEAGPFRDDAIRLREADDLAKTPGKPTDGLENWMAVLEKVWRHGLR